MTIPSRLWVRLMAGLIVLTPRVGTASEKPNIILILADDLGFGDLGCYGSDRFETPHLDALAGGGLRFTDFHSNGAVCSPTRAALLTGRYQQRSGISGVVTAANHRHTGLDVKETTFAELLRGAGYATALFGKWHLGYLPRYNPVRQGFDTFVGYVSGNVDYHNHLDQTGREDWWSQDKLAPETGYTTDLITEHGVAFIQRHRDRPFLLYLAHEAPHYPYQGRRDPPRYIPGRGRTKDPVSPAVYKEMIEVMDEGVGRVVKAVHDAGLAERTLIVFFSDNGPAGPGSAGSWRGRKGQPWEGGHRVPAIAWWPSRIEPGRVSNQPAMGMDLFPTAAAVAGIPVPDHLALDGVNLLPHMLEARPIAPRPLFWQFKAWLAIRDGDHKLVLSEADARPVLYNLRTDPGETTDLSEKRPDVTETLLNRLRAWDQAVRGGVKPRT